MVNIDVVRVLVKPSDMSKREYELANLEPGSIILC